MPAQSTTQVAAEAAAALRPDEDRAGGREADPSRLRVRMQVRGGVSASVEVLAGHRYQDYLATAGPVVLTVAVEVPLTFEDAVAVVYDYWRDNGPDELVSPLVVRELVAEATLNAGCVEIEDRRGTLAGDWESGRLDRAGLAECERAVRAAFDLPAALTTGRPTRRRRPAAYWPDRVPFPASVECYGYDSLSSVLS